MASGDSGKGSAATAVDLGVLAGAVVAGAAGPKGPSPKAAVVAEALRRRGSGESYAAIGRGLGVPLKVVSDWCRTAARVDPRYDARSTTRGVTTDPPTAIRFRAGTRARLRRRAGDRGLTPVIQNAVDAYLGRKVVEVDPGLREALKDELITIAELLADISLQDAGIGRNVNQIAHFINSYREIPIGITAELTELNRRHSTVVDELAAIRDRLDRLIAGSAAA